MKYAATVFGTPNGFQDLFNQPEAEDDEDVASYVSSASASYVYQDLGRLLRETSNPLDTPTLWVAHRLRIENEPSNELLFIGAYRPAFDAKGQRWAFYGAGYWFERGQVYLPGKALQAEITTLLAHVLHTCSKPASHYTDSSKIVASENKKMFSSTLLERRTRLESRLNESVDGISNKISNPPLLKPPSSCDFVDNSRAFVKMAGTHSDVIATLLECFQYDDKLLKHEVIFASADAGIVDDIENGFLPSKRSIVPKKLRNVVIYGLDGADAGALSVLSYTLAPKYPEDRVHPEIEPDSGAVDEAGSMSHSNHDPLSNEFNEGGDTALPTESPVSAALFSEMQGKIANLEDKVEKQEQQITEIQTQLKSKVADKPASDKNGFLAKPTLAQVFVFSFLMLIGVVW